MELTELQRLADGLQPTSDADELGQLDRIIRRLNEVKRISMAELEGPVTGSQYRVTESASAKRSYNTSRILADLGDKGYTVADLVHADAARLSWHWTGLKRVLRDADVTLHVAQHEVEDGDLDDAMVGEVWKMSYRIEGI